jgi:hypothetical protein
MVSKTKKDSIETYDLIEVVSDIPEGRSLGGSGGVAREPQRGDVGAVLEILEGGGDGEKGYIAECVDGDGLTIWVSDFYENEIRLYQKWSKKSQSPTVGTLLDGG